MGNSGHFAVNAGAPVFAQYRDSQAFGANAVIKFSVVIEDFSSLYNTSSGLITIKIPGAYRVGLISAYPNNYPFNFYLQRGSAGGTLADPHGYRYYWSTGQQNEQITGSVLIRCDIGDTLAVLCDVSGTMTDGSFLTIERLNI